MFGHPQPPFIIPMEDDLVHTEHDPFCSDPTCSCHEDLDLLEEVAQQVEQGLLSPEEATRVVAGRQL